MTTKKIRGRHKDTTKQDARRERCAYFVDWFLSSTITGLQRLGWLYAGYFIIEAHNLIG